MKDLDQSLSAYRWEEAEFLFGLIEKYGPEGTFEPYHPHRERLYKYLAHFDASALADAEALLQHFSGSEDELFRLLTERFGVLPHSVGPAVPPPCVSRTGSILMSHASGSLTVAVARPLTQRAW